MLVGGTITPPLKQGNTEATKNSTEPTTSTTKFLSGGVGGFRAFRV